MKQHLRTFHLLTMLLVTLPLAPARAQVVDLDQLPWSINSETMAYDGKTATTIYTGLRFSQGDISIESDEGRASTGVEKNRILQFSGNVIIHINDGTIMCDDADLQFAGSVLNSAIVTGKPATFELRRAGADDVTHAEAGKLLYDVSAGVIEFSDNAKIVESGNEFAANFFVYNIVDRRINAGSSGAEDDRVRITFTPTNENANNDEDSSDDSAETDSENP